MMSLLVTTPLAPRAARAQAVSESILSGVEVAEQGGCSVVKITFNLPVRYLNHFPYGAGQELCIRVRPLAFGANESRLRFTRESLRSPENERAAIVRITYEGDAVNGPCLNLSFRQNVYFEVGQGTDYRSIDIAVSGTTESPVCRPPSRDAR
jgi:hypothetical protein